MNFEMLCTEVEKTGFAIRSHQFFSEIRVATLTTNTIKHCGGKSFSDFAAVRADLFHGGSVAARTSARHLLPETLRICGTEFDAAATAIDELWSAFEDAHIAKLKAENLTWRAMLQIPPGASVAK